MDNLEQLLLELKNLSKTFRHDQQTLTLLDDVHFKLQPAESVAVVGPSGTGKSTLLHICGLLDRGDPPSSEVYFQGQACHVLKADQKAQIRRRHMGFIYQYHHLLNDLSALENVMVPLLMLGHPTSEARTQALNMLDHVGLKNRHTHYPAQLSGGEQQRVSIARALVHKPTLILADEPTGDLDHATSEHVYQTLLSALHHTQAAMIMVTHNLELAQRTQKVVTVHQGKIIRVHSQNQTF